jgi:septum formation protein
MKLILASASVRRIEILTLAGFVFDVRPSDIDESRLPGETPEDYVVRLAQGKAAAVVSETPVFALGADTAVVIDGEILAKPTDAADAVRMLELLSGRRHFVLTGVAVRRTADGAMRAAFDRTEVQFESLSAEWIARYVASGEPFGKAGAYAIQGQAGVRVARIEGNYHNVVGLPMPLVRRLIHDLGDETDFLSSSGGGAGR